MEFGFLISKMSLVSSALSLIGLERIPGDAEGRRRTMVMMALLHWARVLVSMNMLFLGSLIQVANIIQMKPISLLGVRDVELKMLRAVMPAPRQTNLDKVEIHRGVRVRYCKIHLNLLYSRTLILANFRNLNLNF